MCLEAVFEERKIYVKQNIVHQSEVRVGDGGLIRVTMSLKAVCQPYGQQM